MDEERKIWEQEEGESTLWYGRFVKFMRLGTRRSINAVFAKEQRANAKVTRNNEKQRELNAPGEWYDIKKVWKWDERARAYDEYQRAEEDRIIAEERDKIMRSGFALQHKRIQLLDRLSRKLVKMTDDEEKIWIPETRTTIMGEDRSTVVEKVTFNAPLFTTIDKFQDSIAKEMGERVKKKDITVTEMPANVYLTDDDFNPDDDGTIVGEEDGSDQTSNS
jgi:hypothetical protein